MTSLTHASERDFAALQKAILVDLGRAVAERVPSSQALPCPAFAQSPTQPDPAEDGRPFAAPTSVILSSNAVSWRDRLDSQRGAA